MSQLIYCLQLFTLCTHTCDGHYTSNNVNAFRQIEYYVYTTKGF